MPKALTIILFIIQILCFNTAVVFGIVATGPNGSNAQAVHALGNIGTGVNVGLISASNTRVTHEAFRDSNEISHAFWNNATDDSAGYYTGSSGHDTWVAGIIASRGGNLNPLDIGVAPGVNIYSERVITTTGNLSSAYIENALDHLVNQNCQIVFTGFQLENAPDGTSLWTRIYDYYADTYNIVFANPAGNHIYNSADKDITVFGDCYNGITVSGLSLVEAGNYRRIGYYGGIAGYDQVTNIGLTADGRKKPEISAPVQSQTMPTTSSDTAWITWNSKNGETSFAVPHVAGVAALLLSHANSTADTDDNQNEVIRAVIVNSAFPNIRDNNNISTVGKTYNLARGYGRVDALQAYQTLTAGKIVPDDHTTAAKGWAYDNVRRPSSPDIYHIMAAKNQRLAVTIVWNRTFSNKYTVDPLSNLNLEIIDPNGTYTRFSDTGTKDNLKKCDILLPYSGEYQIQITSAAILASGQNYGLAFKIVPPILGDFDLNYIVDFKDLHIFAGQWLLNGSDLSANLATPADNVDFSDFTVFAQNWLMANNAYYAGY